MRRSASAPAIENQRKGTPHEADLQWATQEFTDGLAEILIQLPLVLELLQELLGIVIHGLSLLLPDLLWLDHQNGQAGILQYEVSHTPKDHAG